MSEHGDVYPREKLMMLSDEAQEAVYNHFLQVASV